MKRYIAPIGATNLKTGRCKYFNVYETWDDGVVQFWKIRSTEWSSKDSRYNTHERWRVIFGHADDSVGESAEFFHDQDHSRLFGGRLEKQVDMNKLKEFMNSPDIDLKGSTVNAYVYK